MVDLDIFITSRVKRKIVVFFVTYPAIKMHSRGLAKLLKEDPEENGAGISRQEIPILLCWQNNNYNKLY